MARKQCTEEHLMYGRHGESATGAYFEQIGFDVIHLPDGKFGADLLCKSRHEEFYCGSELRTSKGSWPKHRDSFPYNTYNFLERRCKSDDSILVCWREDMKKGLIIFGQDVKHFSLVLRNNRYANQEDMRLIPIERCLPVSIETKGDTTIALLNYIRIKRAIESVSVPNYIKRKYLLPVKPYGLTSEQYAKFLEISGKLSLADNRKPSPQFVQKCLFDDL